MVLVGFLKSTQECDSQQRPLVTLTPLFYLVSKLGTDHLGIHSDKN